MMKKLTSIILLLSIFYSCQKEDMIAPEDSNLTEEKNVSELEITKEVLEQLESLNFNTQGIEVVSHPNREGDLEEVFLIEGDIIMNPEQLKFLYKSNNVNKQYRTYNVVNNFTTYEIFGYSSGSYALTSKQQNALIQAVANYNALNIGIQFNLTFGSSPYSNDIVVRQMYGNAGGVAGFPSNGNPYNLITIYSGTESYSAAVNEHVLTHEIGHTIGLRHTDWASRESCGIPNPESADPYGAVHIPGTPTGYDSTSLMLACFNSSESGNFGAHDITALEYLYPGDQPFSVMISGPVFADNSSLYTWSANTSNGTPPYTYEWTRTDPSGNEYPWGFGEQSVTARMPNGQDLDLYLEVTDANGEVATATHYTTNTGSGGRPGIK